MAIAEDDKRVTLCAYEAVSLILGLAEDLDLDVNKPDDARTLMEAFAVAFVYEEPKLASSLMEVMRAPDIDAHLPLAKLKQNNMWGDYKKE